METKSQNQNLDYQLIIQEKEQILQIARNNIQITKMVTEQTQQPTINLIESTVEYVPDWIVTK